ncbi:YbaB/EbfC family nucleoid-associated protein [Tsukamurella soli]|uniref:YbaB/EbfC DNA-binding family protein n=1 Tax=Tsukamurella soli TaxID=644556 RepID=A0ABP8K691_9ACTN
MDAAGLLADVERRAAELARVDAEFRDARVTARSRDRLVEVTVDVRGRLVGVALAPAVRRSYPPDALAACLVDLAAQAAASLDGHYRHRAELAVGSGQ